jgi:hypothetical protein
MTLCPIALMTGCKKCMAVDFCMLKTVIGDYKKDDETKAPDKGTDGEN